MRDSPYELSMSIHGHAGAAQTWTNMPAADTFLFGSHRHVQLVDVGGFSRVRLKVNKQATAGAAGAKLVLRYATVFSTTVGDYVDIGETEVSVAVDVQNALVDSGWVDLNGGVPQGDVYVAVVGVGGSGQADPQFGAINVSFRS